MKLWSYIIWCKLKNVHTQKLLAIDGDLFKVRLTFPLYTPADAAQAASSGKETP